jgi:hypothetical protein
VTLIAAVEAYKMCGYEETLRSLRELYDEYEIFLQANAKDEGGDGTKEIKEIGDLQRSNIMKVALEKEQEIQKLATKKTFLFLRTVDPVKFSAAISGINVGLIAVGSVYFIIRSSLAIVKSFSL